MKSHRVGDGERILAVFIDFENVGLGFGNRRDRFSIEKVLVRLVEKGKIVAKKAYADWNRFSNYAASLHAAAVELVEIPKRIQTGKNSADIRMCVDAMDLAYSKDHIDTFVIVSGDSDFSPLVSKLKELGKHVIGLGLQDSTSDLLRDNCDEFLYYEDLDKTMLTPITAAIQAPETKKKVFGLHLDSLLALRRENKAVIFASMVKDTMKRKKPSFNEEYHGYRTFSELLEDAESYGLLVLERHKPSGMYMVLRFGSEPKGLPAPVSRVEPALQRPMIQPAVTPAALPPARYPELPVSRNTDAPIPGSRPSVRENPLMNRTGPPPVQQPPVPTRQTMPLQSRSQKDNEDDEDDARMPLGRALIDEVDILDDDDEIPSYGVPKTDVQKPRTVPSRTKPVAGISKPATTKPSTKTVTPATQANSQTPKPPRSSNTGTTRSTSRASRPKSEQPLVPSQVDVMQSKAPPGNQVNTDDDDASFGAGLD